MRRPLAWIAGAALAITAGVLTALTPSDDAVIGPFLAHGEIGEAAASRTLIATVTEAAFADQVAAEEDWEAEGNWLVVTVVASARTTEVDAQIRLATLTIGDRTFHASERPSTSFLDVPLRVGTDAVGTLAFELPADVTTGTAELRLTTRYATPELDDMIAVPIALDGLPRVDRMDVPEPGLVTP